MATTAARVPFQLFKWTVIGIAFFDILAWLLLLSGVSAMEAKHDLFCSNGVSCRSQFGIAWFVIWFQFVLIFPAFFVEFFDRGAWRPTLMLLLGLNTVLAILQTDKFLNLRDPTATRADGSTFHPYRGSRLNATIAGFIILAIFNLLLIVLSGSRTALEGRYGEDRDVGVATYPSKTRPASPATTTAPSPQVTVPPPQSTYGTTGNTAAV